MEFEGFHQYNKKPNTISCGRLYTKHITLPFSKEKRRILRVWLPEDYDGNKRFPVFYFADGQNIVDKYTTAYGEWEIDERMHGYILDGHSGVIIVGIDCPKEPALREAEYMPTLNDKKVLKREYKPYADKLADYFVNEVKPFIDKTFLTKPEKDFTGFGGSSMGGLFSFYIVNKYPNVFNMSLSFSPAFIFHSNKSYSNYYKTIANNDVRIAFYVGGKDKLEKKILKQTIKCHDLLLEYGFKKDNINLMVNKRLPHNEKSWSRYFIPAISFLLNE